MNNYEAHEYKELIEEFLNNIAVKEYNTLHEAFEDSKINNNDNYKILSKLYKTNLGKEFLKDHYKNKAPNRRK